MPFIKINGRKLFFVLHETERPNRQQRTLLFVHGLGSSHAFYLTIIPPLVALGWNCLAFDSPGSGLSDTPDLTHGIDLNHGIEGIVNDARHLMRQLSIDEERVIVIGHSMGSLVVNTLATSTEIAGVVLIGPINPSEQMSSTFAARVKTVQENGMEAMADTIPVAATGSAAKPVHHAFIRALLLSQSSEGYISLCNAIAGASVPRYAEIKCPVLAIAGSEDQTAKIEGVEFILKACEKSSTSLETLPGVGHWHCIEAPDAVADLIEKFAKGLW